MLCCLNVQIEPLCGNIECYNSFMFPVNPFNLYPMKAYLPYFVQTFDRFILTIRIAPEYIYIKLYDESKWETCILQFSGSNNLYHHLLLLKQLINIRIR